MAFLERRVQKLKKGTLDEYLEWEKRWEALEERLGGFPPKRHYRAISGPYDRNTVEWEREWESFEEMLGAYRRMGEDPETKEIGGGTAASPVTSESIEWWSTLP